MSADLMLVCRERKENYKGTNEGAQRCLKIDETSMGEPWTEFGKMMQAHSGTVIEGAFISRVRHWYEHLDHEEYMDVEPIASWLNEHIGERLQFECW